MDANEDGGHWGLWRGRVAGDVSVPLNGLVCEVILLTPFLLDLGEEENWAVDTTGLHLIGSSRNPPTFAGLRDT